MKDTTLSTTQIREALRGREARGESAAYWQPAKATERRAARGERRPLTTAEGQRLERDELRWKQLLHSTAWHGHAF